MSRLLGFLRDVYAPALHLLFALAWFLALGLAWLAGQPLTEVDWRAWAAWPAGVLVLFLALFYLRVLDELKDEAYDRVFNPERPLIQGRVDHADLRRYLLASAALVLLLALPLAPAAAAVLALNLVWGLALIALERRSALLRDHMLLNLLATYPVNLLLSVFSVQLLAAVYGLAWDGRALLLIVAFACAFLHFEFARKTRWPAFAQPGERLYTQLLGGLGGGIVMLGWALAGVALVLWVLAPWRGGVALVGWLPLLALWPVLATGRRYFRRRDRALKGGAMGFLVCFYASVALAAGVLLSVG